MSLTFFIHIVRPSLYTAHVKAESTSWERNERNTLHWLLVFLFLVLLFRFALDDVAQNSRNSRFFRYNGHTAHTWLISAGYEEKNCSLKFYCDESWHCLHVLSFCWRNIYSFKTMCFQAPPTDWLRINANEEQVFESMQTLKVGEQHFHHKLSEKKKIIIPSDTLYNP